MIDNASADDTTARLFIVEDHPAMQRAYCTLFDRQPDLTVCGVAESAEIALEQIPEIQPDIVIVDVSLKNMNGIELVRRLRGEFANLKLLVISGHERVAFAETAQTAGANGYVMKMNINQILTAIRQILRMDTYWLDEPF